MPTRSAAPRPAARLHAHQTRDKDLALFVGMAKLDVAKTKLSDVPLTVLIPAFMISELKSAFQIGFVIYLPFLVVDMVVSSILMSMGMLMLPPVLITLPFKLLMFILVRRLEPDLRQSRAQLQVGRRCPPPLPGYRRRPAAVRTRRRDACAATRPGRGPRLPIPSFPWPYPRP